MSLEKRFFYVLIIVFSLLSFGCTVSESVPAAKKGIIDIRSWDFSRNHNFNLTGEWEFYWKEFISPDSFKTGKKHSAPIFFNMPAEWDLLSINGNRLEGAGYATIRIVILHRPGERLALYIPKIYTAYSLYINGSFKGRVGVSGKNENESIPRNLPKLVFFTSQSGISDIVFHISNYHHYRGGLCSYNKIVIGTENYYKNYQANRNSITIFLLGTFFIISVFHFILFLYRKDEPSYFYFALTCLISMIWLMTLGEKFIYYLFPGQPWIVLIKIQYISALLSFLSYFLYVYHLYKNDFPVLIKNLLVCVFLVFTVLILVFPSPDFTIIYKFSVIPISFGSIYCIYLVFKVINVKKGNWFFASGHIVVFAWLIYEIVYYSRISVLSLDPLYVTPLALFYMIIVNSVFLSARYSSALKLATELSKDLENKVEERTSQLEQSNKIIEQVNYEQKELLRILCHDLSSPFISTKILLNLAKEAPQQFNRKREKYISEVMLNVQNGLNLIDKVRNMSLSETRKIVPEPVNLFESVKLAEMIIKKMLRSKNIKIVKEIDPELTVLAESAPFINSILLNLLINAVKFSGNGSKVFISGYEDDDRVVVEIKDKGIGIPVSIMDDIFTNPAVCCRAGTSGEKGSGFGLMLARKFIIYYGGEINISSQSIDNFPDSHGTVVTVTMKNGKQQQSIKN